MATNKKKTSPKTSPKKEKASPKARRMTMSVYRKLRESYLEHHSVYQAAKFAGVANSTARRYILEGRPAKNMPAIQNLAKREAIKEEGGIEMTLRTFRQQYLKELMEALQGSLVEIRLHNTKTMAAAKAAQGKGAFEPSSKWIEQIKGHDMLVRLAERAMGEADETVKVDSTADFVKQMTKDEAITYIKTAQLPERLR